MQESAIQKENKNSYPLRQTETDFELGSYLHKNGFLSQDQLKIAEIEQKAQNKRLDEVLIHLGFMSDQVLRDIISQARKISPFKLYKSYIDLSLIQKFPKSLAEKHQVLPLFWEKKNLHVAFVDTYDLAAIDELRRFFPEAEEIFQCVATAVDLSQAIDSLYGHSLSIEELLRALESSPNKDESHTEGAAINFINKLLIDAVKKQASDIHFEPEGAFVRCRYRLDGVLRQMCTFHYRYWPMVLVRLKIMSEMNIAESRFPQNGRFSFCVANREVDFRTASHPIVHGENFVIRILDKRHSLLPLESLGFDRETVDKLKKLIQTPQGLIVVTGPTGSGKTTTLYSMLRYIASPEVNVMTLEEPVEYKLPLIRQTEIREVGGLSFIEGIRSILRQDPDIIFVGETRDEETARMALRAAMTGHLVLTTLHTSSVFDSVSRFKDLGLPLQMLAGHLKGAIAQRLLRKLCCHCKIEKELNNKERELLRNFHLRTDKIFCSQGCKLCDFTGYQGRIAVAEILVFDEQSELFLISDTKFLKFRRHIHKKGFDSMLKAGLKLIPEGIVDIAEIKRVLDIERG